MTPLVTSKKPISKTAKVLQQRVIYRVHRAGAFVIAGLLLALLYMAAPSIFHAYNIARAGSELEVGLKWPSPREVDSVPSVRDNEALNRALKYINAARRWHPFDSYGHRLASRVYAARGEWDAAATELGKAHKFAPPNPLTTWELALVYEHMGHVVRNAPKDNILPDLASLPIDAPQQAIDTVYCRNGNAATCYVDLDKYTQSYAAQPDGPPLTADVLFMHPPAGVQLTRTIPANASALAFLMGLDPNVRSWKTDGAIFEIVLTPQNSSPVLVFQYHLDPITAKRGWVPGYVDLTTWAGQNGTLEFRTRGGIAGNTVDDWYAWGNVAFTRLDAARYAVELAGVQVQQIWHDTGVSADQLLFRGNEAFESGKYQSSMTWWDRALFLDPNITIDAFRTATAKIAKRDTITDEEMRAIQPISILDDYVQIEAEQLRWTSADRYWHVNYGDRLIDHPSADQTVGVLWWDGAGITVVDVRETQQYRITLRAQHSSPSPIEVHIEDNGIALSHTTLTREDGSWEEIVVDTTLHSGLHVLGVRLLNDTQSDAHVRNAVLDWIRIRRSENAE